ncbi:hypothetical protein COCNU_scaffold006084G000010 [Cocos nucifera]|nr:hypothetical protein [Cocos nucifera]
MLEPSTERKRGDRDDKKKKKAVVAKSSHHILAYLKNANRKEVEALKVQGDLQAKIDYAQGKVVEAERLTEVKVVENENLRGALQKEKLISIGLKTALTLEEEKKEAEIKFVKLEVKILKSVLKVAAQAMEEFKASSKMKDLNIAFDQKAFIKGFELCEGRVA